MCDRCVIYADVTVLCLKIEFYSHDGRTQICDDSIGHAEAMHEVLNELDYFGYAVFFEWLVLDPFSELVNSHEDVLETAFSFLERSYLI
jgi:hypothetical protein